jgi:RND family efflux transporter MFP subunit
MKLLKLLLIILLIAAGVVGLRLASIKFSAARAEDIANVPPAQVAPWAVSTQPVRTETLRLTYGTLGTVETISQITVSGQFAGTLTEVGFREGQRVHVGDVLARVDTQEFDAQVAAKEAEAEAAADEAERLGDELEREKKLLATGGSTNSAVEARRTAATAAEKKHAALRAQIGALETRRGYAVLRSPVDGVVSSRLAEVGDLCAPFHPLYKIDADGAARVSLNIPQSLLDQVHVGTPVLLQAGDTKLEAKLTRIHPKLTPTALATLDVDLDELPFGLPSGARLDVKLLLRELEGALVVPAQALRPAKGGKSVLRVDGGVLVELGIEVLFEGDGGIAIRGPVAPGDALVIARPERLAKLHSGDHVQVR